MENVMKNLELKSQPDDDSIALKERIPSSHYKSLLDSSVISAREDILKTERNLCFLKKNQDKKDSGIMPELSGVQKLKKLKATYESQQFSQRDFSNHIKKTYNKIRDQRGVEGRNIVKEANSISDEFHSVISNHSGIENPKTNIRIFTSNDDGANFALCRSIGHVKLGHTSNEDGLIFKEEKNRKESNSIKIEK